MSDWRETLPQGDSREYERADEMERRIDEALRYIEESGGDDPAMNIENILKGKLRWPARGGK